MIISALGVLLSALFSFMIFSEWRRRRRPYQLIWAFAMMVWMLAVLAETVAAARGGWDPTTYRFYYAFGALMVAPWLGAGSLYLVAPRLWARIALALTVIITIIGLTGIFTYSIPAEALAATDDLGFVETRIFPMMPTRLAIILGNIYGSLAFVGGALYSVYSFWRKRIMRERMIGVAVIAAGGMLAAVAHSVGALGGPSLFHISQFAALLLIFGGYLKSNRSIIRATPPRVAGERYVT
jgi:hypothetical protein